MASGGATAMWFVVERCHRNRCPGSATQNTRHEIPPAAHPRLTRKSAWQWLSSALLYVIDFIGVFGDPGRI
jgi:hypothetical protein